jgi:putative ABC transport system substrate-binding protein
MRRREVIGLGGAAILWPFAAQAQQKQVVGFLNSASPESFKAVVAAFHLGLNDTGYVEGHNVTVEYRWANGDYNRLPQLASNLARQQVSVIVATGGAPAALAAKAATQTIPIVFSGGGDPVGLGLVDSLSRPSGNATGMFMHIVGQEPKRLELLRELVPDAAVIAFLSNPTYPAAADQVRSFQQAARTFNQQTQILRASTEAELDMAFGMFAQQRSGAVLVAADPFFNSRRDQLTALAARYAIPVVYDLREFVVAGGLISYGNSLTSLYRQLGIYTGRILRGERPSDLPVAQAATFELVINLRTAKALGLTVPSSILARADEVIE